MSHPNPSYDPENSRPERPSDHDIEMLMDAREDDPYYDNVVEPSQREQMERDHEARQANSD